MNDPRNISILDYSYHLPDKKIAYHPLAERDASKLLVYKDGKITTDTYRHITSHLSKDSFLVFNNTKVIEARLLFKKPTGGMIEIFCLEPHEQYPDITTAMLQQQKVWWKCLVGGASKWKRGQVLEKKTGNTVLYAKCIDKTNQTFIIELSWSPASLSFAEVLHFAGAIPLPPYIKRAAAKEDKDRYQTIYAGTDGSVAAPTAGLHFTDTIFNDLKEKNIPTDFVTLHVGAGTFKPVSAQKMEDHEMHAEWIDVSRATIENILKCLDNNIIAVGTTSLRTIESLYWLGAKLKARRTKYGSEPESLEMLTQWEAYGLMEENAPVKEALEALLEWLKNNKMDRLVTKTQILIAPGYEFKIAKGLVTNFHQPQSTLLLLVAALIGEDWKKVYNYALQNDFRFLSYGDGCLLWRN